MSGSAVLTALQAKYKNIDEIGNLVRERRIQAFIKGRNSEEWLSDFWKSVAKCRG